MKPLSTNKDRLELIVKHQKRAKELYLKKHPDNGKTVKPYWEKCREAAAKELGMI